MARIGGSVLYWRLAWLASALAICAAETMPWSNFQGHPHWMKVCWIPFADHHLRGFWLDICQNIFLVAAFGFTGVHAMRKATLGAAAIIISSGFLLMASGELFQVYCHNRFPTMTDVTSGTIGALMGFLIGRRW